MTPTSPSRRDVLKAGAVITAAASVGLGEVFTARRAHAQGGAAPSRARIDGVLKQAVDAREVPGVVAMAATDKGKVYEGAFGTRDLGKGPDMTLDTLLPHRVDDQGHHVHGRACGGGFVEGLIGPARRAGQARRRIRCRPSIRR